MSASGYFAMYGSGSFSLRAKNPFCNLHVPHKYLQPLHLSQFFVLHTCHSGCRELLPGSPGAQEARSQASHAHQTVSTSDTSMSKPMSVKVSIRWIFSRPCAGHTRHLRALFPI